MAAFYLQQNKSYIYNIQYTIYILLLLLFAINKIYYLHIHLYI